MPPIYISATKMETERFARLAHVIPESRFVTQRSYVSAAFFRYIVTLQRYVLDILRLQSYVTRRLCVSSQYRRRRRRHRRHRRRPRRCRYFMSRERYLHL